MAYNLNNEEIGISAEVAIANVFSVNISSAYVQRSDMQVVNFLSPYIESIFINENIPAPVKHIAEGQSPIDFILSRNKTLSVKTNQNDLGRAAPQNIGQPSSSTYFSYIENIFPNFDLQQELRNWNLADTYQNRAKIFKRISINNIDTMINIYWQNIFDCDYLILFYNIVSPDGYFYCNPSYRVFGKDADLPNWDIRKFGFTQTEDSWKESCTLKYDGITIGNFQVHNNRDCFKFRFDMRGISRLIDSGEI